MHRNRLAILPVLLMLVCGCGRRETPPAPQHEPTAEAVRTGSGELERTSAIPVESRRLYDLVASIPTAGGWQAAADPRVFVGQKLTDMINGAAERYFRYDFKAAVRSDYSNPEVDNPITVDVYDVGTDADAFGMHSLTGMLGTPVDIGNDGVYSPPSLLFWKGQCLVHIYAVRESPEAKQAVVSLGRSIAEGIEEPGARPEIVAVLPEDPSRGHVVYLHQDGTLVRSDFAYVVPYEVEEPNPFNLSAATEMALAEYDVGGEFPAAVFVVAYPTPEEARVATDKVGTFARAALVGRHLVGAQHGESAKLAELFAQLEENVGRVR